MGRSLNYLFVVEGEKDEKSLLCSIFQKSGFNSINCQKPFKLDGIGQFQKYEFSLNKDNVCLIQGPRNRIHDFLKLFNNATDSIEKAFSFESNFFAAIFLIYDVDHNDCKDVEEMFNKFQDESSGMLLLNSPCLEVLADFERDRTEEKYGHLSEYKSIINKYHSEKNGISAVVFLPKTLMD